MDRFIQFINTSEGRDKTGKVIQYGSRIIQWQQKGINDEVHQSFRNLFCKSPILKLLFIFYSSFSNYVKCKKII